MKPKLCAIFFFLFIHSLHTEEIVYYIRAVECIIDGKTKKEAALLASEINIGDELRSEALLNSYISRKTQNLLNRRQFASAEIEYNLNDSDDDGRVPVDLVLKITDSNNFVILPYPKFSSSSGTKLEVRIRDYNFFGNLSEGKINAGYERDTYGNNYVNALVDFGIPFSGFGFLWKFGFLSGFLYRINNAENPFSVDNAVSIDVSIPVFRSTLTFGFEQDFKFKTEELFDYDYEKSPFDYLVSASLDIEDFHERFISRFISKPYAEIKVPTGLYVIPDGELKYNAKTELNIHYFLFQDDNYSAYNSILFSHSLNISKIDWIKNFQRGIFADIENNNEFYIDDNKKNKYDISVTAVAHIPIVSFLGLSFRARYQTVLFTQTHYLAAGGPLRGIPDKSLVEPEKNITATEMAFINIDLPFHIFTFMPVEFGSGKKLEIISFDLQISPFFDIAVLKDSQKISDYKWLTAAGFEIKIFPYAFRSIFFRISAGFDLQKSFGQDNYEIFIGLGNHY